jgi:MFS family permease
MRCLYHKFLGRLVAGIGLGVLSCCFSEITKNTNDEERGKILARVMMGRQIGLILGPTANFIFLNVDTKIKLGSWTLELNNLTAPGLLMTCLWFLLEIFILLFYKNLNKFTDTSSLSVSSRVETSEESEATNLLNNNNKNENEAISSYQSFGHNRTITTDEQEIGGNINEERGERIIMIDNSQTGSLFKRLYNEYIREEVVAVLSITFTVFFMQTTLEVRLSKSL